MYVLEARQMRNADAMTCNEYGLSGMVLMENAARAVYDYIIQEKYEKIVIVCGGGNNGGDGFALARQLLTHGQNTRVFCFADISRIKGDAALNLHILKKMDVEIEANIDNLGSALERCQVVVDAIFGTGFRGEVQGSYKQAIELINSCGRNVISVDMPSGINTDNGKEANAFVKADCTITFCCKKPGQLLGAGREASGRVIVSSISMPEDCILKQEPYITTNDQYYPSGLIKKRRNEAHKGDFGRVYIISGSYSMSGAAALCAKAALRTGCGLVTCVLPESIMDRVGSIVPEATFLTFGNGDESGSLNEDKLNKICTTADSVALGPGMGTGMVTFEILNGMLEGYKGPMVIDADGINILSEHRELLNKLTPNTILTPHPGEMARLTGLTVKQVNADRMDIAKGFAERYGCILLLKGASTVVTSGKKIYINTTGNPGMATGGSGDVLTGMISSLCGQGYEPYEAAVLGCYLHGCAGDEAMVRYGYGITAGDITDYINVIMP